jgi:hypothetical protein
LSRNPKKESQGPYRAVKAMMMMMMMMMMITGTGKVRFTRARFDKNVHYKGKRKETLECGTHELE